MSDFTPPIPPPPSTPSAPPAKRSFLANQWLRYGVVFILGLGIGGAVATAGDETSAAGESPAPSSVSVAPTLSPTPSSEPSPTPSPTPTTNPEPPLQRQDIELSLKTTEKQCFGSAGCLISVKIEVSVPAGIVAAFPPDGQWDVTYQITGDESGPIIGTLSIYGNGKYDVNEENLSTKSENTPVRVKVLDVERVS
jgi:hypothetical protein